MHAIRWAVLTMMLGSSSAMAKETFSIGLDAGGGARYIDNLALSDPDGYGLSIGLRTEVNFAFHFKADARYFDGQLFSSDEHRYVDFSASASTPALLVFALDVHELYYRYTTRRGDDLFYVNTGLGVKGRILGNSLKASLGFSYLSADDIGGETNENTMGAYVGAEHMLRSKFVDTNLRAAWFISLTDNNNGDPYMGLLTDADVTVKFPVGKAFLGPRLDVAYRNLGLNRGAGDLFGQKHELSGSLGLAFHWGTGGGAGRKKK